MATPEEQVERVPKSQTWLWAAFLLATLPFLYLSLSHTTNEYLYRYVAFSTGTLQDGSLQPSDTLLDRYPFIEFNAGFGIFVPALSAVTGIAPQWLQFLPIGAGMFLLGLVALGDELPLEQGMAVGLALVLALDPSLGISNYSIWLYAFNVGWYLVFIGLTLSMIRSPSWQVTVVAFVIYGAAVFFHQTGPMWMASLWIALAILWQLFATRRHTPTLLLNGGALFAVAYLTFNKVVYKDFLPHLVEGGFTETGANIALRLLHIVGIGQGIATEPYTSTAPGNLALNVTGIAQYLIIGAFLATLLWQWLRLLARGGGARNLVREHPLILVLVALLVTGAVDVSAYLARGGFLSLKYVALFVPVIIVVGLVDLGRKRLAWTFMTILGVLLMAKYAAFASIDFAQPSDYSDVHDAAAWFDGHIMRGAQLPDNQSVMSDLITYGQMSVYTADHPPPFLAYTSERYAWLVTPGAKLEQPDAPTWVFVNQVAYKDPVLGYNWQYFEPISQHESQIVQNPGVSRLYDDGRISILQVHSAVRLDP